MRPRNILLLLLPALGAAALFALLSRRPAPAPATGAEPAALATPPVASLATPVSRARAQALVKRTLRDPTLDPAAEKEISAYAQRADAAEASFHGARALDQRLDNTERQASLHLLTRMPGLPAATALASVVAAPVPSLSAGDDSHSPAARRQAFEVALRIGALEALDQSGIDAREKARLLDHILETQSQPSLVLLTRVSQGGLKNPGALQRFIKKTFSAVDGNH